MLDIKFIRENPELIKKTCKQKKIDLDVDFLLELDKERRKIKHQVEIIRAEKNKASKEIPKLSEKEKKMKIEEMKKLDRKEERLKAKLKKIEKEFDRLMLLVPMPVAKDVPVGESDRDNLVVKEWGEIPKFDFQPKDYITLMKNLDLLDLERGAKIGGFRGYVIKNEAVLLELALLKWSLEFLISKGFKIFRPTILVREFAMTGTGMFPFGEKDAYKVDKDLYLAGTTEVPLMAYFANEILDEKDLPIKMAGISCAFRTEVGSYGKDVKGIFRVHEFWQTEQVIICKNDERESIFWHEQLLKNSEEMMQALKIPYRVVNCCTGDLAPGQVKRYDIEAWVPSQQKYRETHSDSYLLDFQTRRLNIRYRERSTGKLKFAHSLNQTAIAVPRILIPLIENHQQKDGSIKIPEVLHPYLPFEEIKR
jgi:seryl-tRNA synthetase